jgi:hypothetical protein
MQAVSNSTESESEDAAPDQTRAWRVLAWCLPTLLGAAAFLCAFPIDRQIPSWPRLNIAEVFCAWFLFATPAATMIAIVKFTRDSKLGHFTRITKWLLRAVITVAILLNLLLLFGFYAAAAF